MKMAKVLNKYRGGMSSVWEDHVRQFSEECDYGLASISATEYDLGMSYWEGYY